MLAGSYDCVNDLLKYKDLYYYGPTLVATKWQLVATLPKS